MTYEAQDLALREGKPRKSIVPMIMAEIMRSMSASVDGRIFFDGGNLHLQLWSIKDFHKRSDMVDIFLLQGNKTDNLSIKMVHLIVPVGFVGYQIFLTEI